MTDFDNTPDEASDDPTVSEEDIEDISESHCAALRKARRQTDATYESLSEEYDYTITTILQHVKGKCSHTHEDQPPVDDDQPWRERAVLYHLFIEENKYFTEMSNLLGCHDETARNWVSEHDITEDGTHYTSSKLVRQLTQMEVDPHEDLDDSIEGSEDSDEDDETDGQ